MCVLHLMCVIYIHSYVFIIEDIKVYVRSKCDQICKKGLMQLFNILKYRFEILNARNDWCVFYAILN